ncbi:AraC family transcriptional regulator [Kineosporia sp. NBRC 101731]|uniref:AraC family transcriptional regulator n=1 Tax=Kineosporia sp. NBRC 101731 TaxID=3032199 RepID=UPI0024A44D51|nr:AraC family transcriptional regulator [Kineosporia sp. NBRC 101731]GLY31518.1 AraC family transcriptional regulator [Kineosporia sp. NBRC 101731]
MDVLSDAIGAMRAGRPSMSLSAADPSGEMKVGVLEGARFYVVTAGSVQVTRSGEPPVTLEPGDAVLFPHGAAHELVNATDERAHFLSGAYRLDQARPHPLFQDLPDLVVLFARAGRFPSLRASIDLARSELDEEMYGRDLVLPALLDVLLVQLIRACLSERAGRQGTGWCVALDDEAVSRSLRAVHERPADPWTVESLGAHAGLSRAAFARRFTTMVGQPPLTYLTWWRLTTAARMLQTTDAPLSVVAQRSGYGSAYAFANAFKREYGISAGRYRQQHREGRSGRGGRPSGR